MHKISLTRQAEKEYTYLYRANRYVFTRIRAALHSLAKDPYQGKPLSLSLKGRWSYRTGSYRILYMIQKEVVMVIVMDIGHRREIYR